MKKTPYIIIPLLILGLMEVAVWMVMRNSSTAITDEREAKMEQTSQDVSQKNESREEPSAPAPYSVISNTDPDNFPVPTTEVKNGRTERTIHMGVRQYVWEPATITAKKGELVRLIIHNADVQHGLVIPELGVMNIDIPPDGAVIEFIADKVGTFEFFCSYYCGDGHMEMRGKIIIQ